MRRANDGALGTNAFLKSRLIWCIVFVMPFLPSRAQSPGNVSTGLIWWLKANAQVYTNNGTTAALNSQAVQQWNDQSSSNTDARQTTATNKPVYQTNMINGNPAIVFSGDQFLTALSTPGVSSTNSFHMFIVMKQYSYFGGGIGDGNGTYIIDRYPETDNLMSLKITDTDKYTYQKRNNSGQNLEGPVSVTSATTGTYNLIDFGRVYNSSYNIYIDGRLDVSSTNNAGDAITGPTIQIGRHAVNTNQGLNGEIAEVVLYNTALSTTNRRRIESYLAIKYGITIDQTSLTDYTNSAGTVVYPVASNAGYNGYRYDIAGIGRDNNSGLNQNNSQSQNSATMVSIFNPSSLGNGDFLLWGNNNGSLDTPNKTDVGGIIDARLSRVWRVAHTNNVGNVTVSVDLTNVPGPKVQSDLRLMIDRDGDGFSDNDITPKTGTLVGSVFTVTNVTFQNGDYFTVGTTNVGTTPLPIRLLDFRLTSTDKSVQLSWETSMEKNNDYFSVEKASDGGNWSEVLKVKSQGDSYLLQHYQAEDVDPFPGTSYYRLRQVDLDKTETVFPVKVVTFRPRQRGIVMYPNPNQGSMLYFETDDQAHDLEHVEIRDQQGIPVASCSCQRMNADSLNYSCVFDTVLPAGLYNIKVFYNGQFGYFKLSVL